jgi:predicted peptidase
MFVAVIAAFSVSQVPSTFSGKVVKPVRCEYLVYQPEGYTADRDKKWPTILFLHGAGERGTDLNKVKLQGIPKELATGRKLPFLVVAPQCQDGAWWDPDTLGSMMDEVERKWRVDPNRIYVTGLSMGGYGTWALAAAQPGRFAAIAPICGGGNPLYAAKIAHIPAWIVHGTADPVVPFSQSKLMVQWLQWSKAPDLKFTEVPDGGHDVWTDFYRGPELFDWFLTKSRVAKPIRELK